MAGWSARTRVGGILSGVSSGTGRRLAAQAPRARLDARHRVPGHGPADITDCRRRSATIARAPRRRSDRVRRTRRRAEFRACRRSTGLEHLSSTWPSAAPRQTRRFDVAEQCDERAQPAGGQWIGAKVGARQPCGQPSTSVSPLPSDTGRRRRLRGGLRVRPRTGLRRPMSQQTTTSRPGRSAAALMAAASSAIPADERRFASACAYLAVPASSRSSRHGVHANLADARGRSATQERRAGRGDRRLRNPRSESAYGIRTRVTVTLRERPSVLGPVDECAWTNSD